MRINELSKKTQQAILLKYLIDKYYEFEPTGGCLHIILDDGNYDSDCTKYCLSNNDIIGQTIMKLLKEFSIKEKELILEEYWKIEDAAFNLKEVKWNT